MRGSSQCCYSLNYVEIKIIRDYLLASAAEGDVVVKWGKSFSIYIHYPQSYCRARVSPLRTEGNRQGYHSTGTWALLSTTTLVGSTSGSTNFLS